MVTHSSILAWRIPWTEEPRGLQSTGVTKSRTRHSDFTFTFIRFLKTLEDSTASLSLLEISLKACPSPYSHSVSFLYSEIKCVKRCSLWRHYSTDKREEMFYFQVETLTHCDKGVFLFGEGNAGAVTLFTENEGLLRTLASFHN